jgi:AcrR family transcriptional regulator
MSERESTSSPEAHEDIMDATYHALLEHGFAALTMQDIADEAEKSKSLLHYHYDTKQDLLVEFLEYLIERGEERAEEHADDPPHQHLREFVAGGLVDTDEDDWAFVTAVVELEAQALHDETYREQLARNEAKLRDHIADIIRDGIETGDFRDVDPESTARLILTAIDGARTQRVVLDDDSPELVHDALVEHVLEPLERDDAGNDTTGDDTAGDATAADATAADATAADATAGDATADDERTDGESAGTEADE